MTDPTGTAERLRLTRDDLTLMELRAQTASTYAEHHRVGRDARALVGEVRALLDEHAAAIARIAEFEAERADTGSTHRELLARIYCPDCNCRKTSLAHATRCFGSDADTHRTGGAT